MSVLGIITCEVLELEIAHLLAADPNLSRVTILEDGRSARLADTLESMGLRNLRRIPHLNSFSHEPSEQPEVLVRVMELALHRRKKILRKAISEAARAMKLHVDAFLLGYGLCGSALNDPRELLDVEVPVFIPMDHDHPVDDCVGLLLGGRDQYYAEQRKIPGTYFMTPGWTNHWRKIFGRNCHGMDTAAVKRMFNCYQRSLLIVTPIMPQDEMQRKVDEFNRLTGCRSEVREGTLAILDKTWSDAMAFLASRRPTGQAAATAGEYRS